MTDAKPFDFDAYNARRRARVGALGGAVIVFAAGFVAAIAWLRTLRAG